MIKSYGFMKRTSRGGKIKNSTLLFGGNLNFNHVNESRLNIFFKNTSRVGTL